MPRSADRPVSRRPPWVMAPEGRRSSPAIQRRTVDLAQPAGPTMHENSRPGIASAMCSSAVTGRPLRPPKRTVTSSIRSLLKRMARGSEARRPRQEPTAQQLEQLVRDQAQDPDDDDAENDDVGEQTAHGVQDHV